jgi:adenylyl-sulfate kinase
LNGLREQQIHGVEVAGSWQAVSAACRTSACHFTDVAACFGLLTAPQDTFRLPAVIWITGLPAAGKTTLAQRIQATLRAQSVPVVVLDGDDLRRTVNADLGYGEEARHENVRRIGEIARVLVAQSFTVVVACISPFRAQRDALRRTFPEGQFVEVFADTPIEVCQQRDPKGLYRRAAAGALRQMTGVDAGYEAPFNPELVFKPDGFDEEEFLRRFRL